MCVMPLSLSLPMSGPDRYSQRQQEKYWLNNFCPLECFECEAIFSFCWWQKRLFILRLYGYEITVKITMRPRLLSIVKCFQRERERERERAREREEERHSHLRQVDQGWTLFSPQLFIFFFLLQILFSCLRDKTCCYIVIDTCIMPSFMERCIYIKPIVEREEWSY